MNKVLPYIVIAILLGTVTMIVPYALLGSNDYTSMTEGDTLIQPSPTNTEQPSAPTESSTPMPTHEPVPSPVPSTVPSPTPETSAEGGELSNGDSLAPSSSALTETPSPVPTSPPSSREPVPVPTPAPSAVPSPLPETSELEPSQTEEPSSAETEAPLAPQPAFDETDLIAESLSRLPAIGLMIVPSFLIALGAFVYLKKRRS
jgi:hypothetical protein